MLRSYINYRFKAKSRHGVHSPFVYRIVEDVIQSSETANKAHIESLRYALKKDKQVIQLRDLGAGSREGIGNKRSVAKIASNSATRPADAMFLQRLVDHCQCQNILELGTNLGLTTAYLASAQCAPHVVSVEGDPSLAALARANLNELNINAKVVTGAFEDALPDCLRKMGRVDMAYIDGNHRLEPTMAYFQQIVQYVHDGAFIAIGDIHWSSEMEQAWEQIRCNPEVTVSMDLFYMGLVFFRKGQAPEHFTLKYP